MENIPDEPDQQGVIAINALTEKAKIKVTSSSVYKGNLKGCRQLVSYVNSKGKIKKNQDTSRPLLLTLSISSAVSHLMKYVLQSHLSDLYFVSHL